MLWIFSCSILIGVLLFSYFTRDGDVSYGRLSEIPSAGQVTWVHCIPPLVLLLLTRYGFPVSTTFLVLTFFAPGKLDSMLVKSIVGYLVSFTASFLAYRYLATKIEHSFFHDKKVEPGRGWVVIQWLTTGFLWSQWLIQDLANIYVYAGQKVSGFGLVGSLLLLVLLHAYMFYTYGGEIQKIVTAKVNTRDIRSASLIDLQFGLVLLVFKEWSNMPMSTTWVFLGVLAGREVELASKLNIRSKGETGKMIGADLLKAGTGLVVSVVLALALPLLGGARPHPPALAVTAPAFPAK